MNQRMREPAPRRADVLAVWKKRLAGVGALVLGLVTASAATAQYPGPGSSTTPTPGPTSLIGIGNVAPISPAGIRLTFPAPYQRGAVWLAGKQPIAGGFQSTFQFQISGIGGIIEQSPFGLQQGGDGFAFVIQNYSIPVVGPPAGFLGYHGIPNSLAVEFDTWWNGEFGFFDPNGNHISVHTRGVRANSVSETASIGQATQIPFMKDGALHTARVDYTPGTLRVFLDDPNVPVLTIPGLDLSNLLILDNGSAWVGFTAGTGAAFEAHDILAWQMIGAAGVPVTPGGQFPVTPMPTTPMPTTPAQPYVLPPSPTSPPAFAFPASP
jgi:hypothetical protein